MINLESFGIKEGRGKYYEETIYSLVLIYNLINDEISTYLAQYELTPGKFNILMILKHHGNPEGISQVDISKRLIVTPSNMTKLIDKLEKDGLVTRSSMKNDRRVNIMRITSKGEKVLDQSWEGYDEKLKAVLHGIDQSKQKILAQLLRDWLSVYQKG